MSKRHLFAYERRDDMATATKILTMKAVRIYSYGGPQVLVEENAPMPKPSSAEVLIEVHAAGVNPIDWKVREGYAKEWLRHKLPLILGWDVSGVIKELVAESKVSKKAMRYTASSTQDAMVHMLNTLSAKLKTSP
jgi:NADPH:quinone reductase-like Zn-dependent oxidoreductase